MKKGELRYVFKNDTICMKIELCNQNGLLVKKLEQHSNSKLLLKFALFKSTTHSTKYSK
jgi:hypothetical protein